jgi:Fic family protein
MTKTFKPIFTITNRITSGLTRIERARGFLEAATLSEDWIREMGRRALVLEAYHTTHIEGTRLTLDQAERLLAGNLVPEADPDDARELLNYLKAFDFVSEYLASGDPITEGLIREIQIHPFLDGNGRTSRLLSTLYLYRAGYDFKRLFTISEYYDRDRSAFYRAIQSVREHGMDMTG